MPLRAWLKFLGAYLALVLWITAAVKVIGVLF